MSKGEFTVPNKGLRAGDFSFLSGSPDFVRMCQLFGDDTEPENLYKTQADADWWPRERVALSLVGPSRPTISDRGLLSRPFLEVIFVLGTA